MNPDKAEIIILVGSKKGGTLQFAESLKAQLAAKKKQVALLALNEFQAFPKMKQIVVFTATYGKGVAPKNASRFLEIIQKTTFNKSVNFSVIGFGSVKYKTFCKYAKDVNQELSNHSSFLQFHEPAFVDRNCELTYNSWLRSWSKKMGISVLEESNLTLKKTKSYKFKVKSKYETIHNALRTVHIELKTKKHDNINGGDFLIIKSKKSEKNQFTVRKLNNKSILISYQPQLGESVPKQLLKPKKTLKARHICNTKFRLFNHQVREKQKELG